MTAAGHHHEPLVSHINHQSLIIMDQWIRLPRAVDLGVMNGKPGLELGCAMDLPGYQHHTFEQIGAATLLEKLDIFLF